MPGALATIGILDKDGNPQTVRVWDESGTGVGPFQFVKQTAKADGVVIDPATSTKQPALGTAGTPSADVLSVQGRSGMTPLQVQETVSSIASGQATVDTTSGGAEIVAARAARKSVTIINHGTVDVFLGPSGVTTGNGALLLGIKGASFTIDGGAAVRGIVDSGSQVVSYLESF